MGTWMHGIPDAEWSERISRREPVHDVPTTEER